MFSPAAWLRAFLLTAAIELPVVLVATRRLTHVSRWRRALLALFAQLSTHPLVWFVFPRIAGITGGTAVILAELWAWFGEALFYFVALAELGTWEALGIAGVANALSFAIGLLIY